MQLQQEVMLCLIVEDYVVSLDLYYFPIYVVISFFRLFLLLHYDALSLWHDLVIWLCMHVYKLSFMN